MRKHVAPLLALCLLAATVNGCGAEATALQRYSMSFFDTFDTIVIIIGYAPSEAVFNRVTSEARAQYERLHRVYDAYNAYDGVGNLHALNRLAAQGPVKVEPELMELLQYCKEVQPTTRGTVNIALGSVLKLWHDFREDVEAGVKDTRPPAIERLRAAAEHTNFDDVILDVEAGTVAFLDPELSLDVGSVAKGYATERVAQWMLTSEMPSFIINAGGNVRAGDPPQDGRLRWGVSVQNPDSGLFTTISADEMERLFLTNTSAVTSGDYQRLVTVDGRRYHHLISPDTLMPGDFVRAVTIVTEDSGYADLLSTAAFLMPYAESRAFIESLPGVEALWALPDGTVEMTEGMRAMAYTYGASSK